MPPTDPCILILTSSTGGGHDQRAYAFQEWVRRLYGDRVTVHVEHILENSSRLTRFGVWTYNTIQRHAPALHNIYWYIAELFGMMQGRGLGWGGGYFTALLQRWQPHVILSVHDSTNRGYFDVARRMFGDRVCCATYCGEFSGGFGYSRIWISPHVDLFYSRTAEAERHALALGLPAAKARRFQNFLAPHALAPPMDSDARSRFLRDELGLLPDRFTILLATGAVGANRHIAHLETLRPFADRIQVIVICGHNQRLLSRVAAWSENRSGALRTSVKGHSRRVPQLLQAADLVVARGGANLAAEAVFTGCPILFFVRSIMPQERLTVRYLSSKGAALSFSSDRELARAVAGLLDSPDRMRQLREGIAATRASDHPEEFVRALVTRGEELAHS